MQHQRAPTLTLRGHKPRGCFRPSGAPPPSQTATVTAPPASAMGGMADMLASLESLPSPVPAAKPASAKAWLDGLPDLSYMLSAELQRPRA